MVAPIWDNFLLFGDDANKPVTAGIKIWFLVSLERFTTYFFYTDKQLEGPHKNSTQNVAHLSAQELDKGQLFYFYSIGKETPTKEDFNLQCNKKNFFLKKSNIAASCCRLKSSHCKNIL